MYNEQQHWPWKYDFIPSLEAREFFAKGREQMAAGDWLSALSSFEKAVQLECCPLYSSFLALCIAKERGLYRKAITICEEAIAIDPTNTFHFLNLGKILLLRGDKIEAIRIFRAGLKIDRDPLIIMELNNLGIRKSPVIPFLLRNNPINKYLGIILHKLARR